MHLRVTNENWTQLMRGCWMQINTFIWLLESNMQPYKNNGEIYWHSIHASLLRTFSITKFHRAKLKRMLYSSHKSLLHTLWCQLEALLQLIAISPILENIWFICTLAALSYWWTHAAWLNCWTHYISGCTQSRYTIITLLQIELHEI